MPEYTKMEYTKTFNDLKNIFTADKEEITIPESDVKIYNIGFRSDFPEEGFINASDTLIAENRTFSYPVFTPGNLKSDKVILLLHGLNERSWLKYLVWAYWLAESTESYVILFPISFHINRSPASWKDPRTMIPLLKTRNSTLGEIKMSSFANIALSNRLTESPLRFYNSGYQTVTDLTRLLLEIRNGQHRIIPKGSNINIFAYSIGAFLAQILLMGNPENLLTGSRLFIFCGGSVFSNMKGSSKLIMDSNAFERVYRYYLYEFEKSMTGKNGSAEFLSTTPVGMAFRSMIDIERLKTFRENILTKLRDQIHSITLRMDTVIPSAGVISTLNLNKNRPVAEVWDFPYNYSHENPFPLFNNHLSKEVDRCFENVFSRAKNFFS
jgi:pimeloyl-ACP methyl ester carboxylesterase